MSNLTPAQVVETLSKIGRDIDETTETIATLDEEVVRSTLPHDRGVNGHPEAYGGAGDV